MDGLAQTRTSTRPAEFASPTGPDLVHLDLSGVRTVGIDRTHHNELLRVGFPDDAPAATLWLRMKPDVVLQWSYDPTT
jgi:hypothetical protein